MDPARSHHRSFAQLFALPGKPFSQNILWLTSFSFKHLCVSPLPEAFPSPPKTINHSTLIYLFCSIYLKSCDLLFCLLACLSPLLQCRFRKSGTLLIFPSTVDNFLNEWMKMQSTGEKFGQHHLQRWLNSCLLTFSVGRRSHCTGRPCGVGVRKRCKLFQPRSEARLCD